MEVLSSEKTAIIPTAQSFSENVFLAHFNEQTNKHKPSSLWCVYSMLKSTGSNHKETLRVLRRVRSLRYRHQMKLKSFRKKLRITSIWRQRSVELVILYYYTAASLALENYRHIMYA